MTDRALPPSASSRRLLTPFVALALLAAGCASARVEERETDVARLVARGQFDEAVRVAAEIHERNPDDALAADNYRRASAAWFLEQGRRAAFEGLDFEALDHFHAARDIAPEAHEVDAWILKMRDNLAESFLAQALEAHIKDDLNGASEAYERVLDYRSDDRQARHGLARVLLQLNYRQGMGDAYYDKGVRALSDYWLYEAKSKFGYVDKYLPDSVRSDEHRARVAAFAKRQRSGS